MPVSFLNIMETVYKLGKIMIYNLLWSFICPKNKEKEKKE